MNKTTALVAPQGLSLEEVPDESPISISQDVVVLSDPTGNEAEGIRQLRTRLVAQHLERGGRALAVCSPSKESGCSFVAANLAVAFAQTGTRVLLIDGDLREAGLDAIFGGEPGRKGLADVLKGGDPAFGDILAREIIDGLWFLPAGSTNPNAQELLSNRKFEALCDRSTREFDLTIIDTPPASLFADAQLVSSILGHAIIVARSHETYFNDVGELFRQMQADGVEVVGTILNQK